MINICETCRHRYKRKDQEPCKECRTETGINWEPEAQNTGAGIQMKGVETMKEKSCENCKYGYFPFTQSPCNQCIFDGLDYSRYWEPQEAEDEEKKEEKGKKEIELKKRPEILAYPVPIYERTDSEIPEKVRISFTNGTSAIYARHVDQPKPLVMESIRIIRKWRSEGYQYVAPRRRRSRK